MSNVSFYNFFFLIILYNMLQIKLIMFIGKIKWIDRKKKEKPILFYNKIKDRLMQLICIALGYNRQRGPNGMKDTGQDSCLIWRINNKQKLGQFKHRLQLPLMDLGSPTGSDSTVCPLPKFCHINEVQECLLWGTQTHRFPVSHANI